MWLIQSTRQNCPNFSQCSANNVSFNVFLVKPKKSIACRSQNEFRQLYKKGTDTQNESIFCEIVKHSKISLGTEFNQKQCRKWNSDYMVDLIPYVVRQMLGNHPNDAYTACHWK